MMMKHSSRWLLAVLLFIAISLPEAAQASHERARSTYHNALRYSNIRSRLLQQNVFDGTNATNNGSTSTDDNITETDYNNTLLLHGQEIILNFGAFYITTEEAEELCIVEYQVFDVCVSEECPDVGEGCPNNQTIESIENDEDLDVFRGKSAFCQGIYCVNPQYYFNLPISLLPNSTIQQTRQSTAVA